MDNTIKNPFIDQQNSENSIDNINNISMSDSELLALQEKERKRQNSLKNLRPLRPDNELTPEEIERKKEIIRSGAIARNKQAAKQRSMKESTKQLLQAKVTKDYAKKILGDDADLENVDTMQDLIMARMLREILENGNTKAAEFIRDTSGEKPVAAAALDIKADIVTAADRALIEKVADRLGMVDITNDDDNENR